ncbi:hypothetical protein QE152_g27640 [Popillia japonica]|uniref:DNA-directed DNA polymerase n=1 Tax=Popillia japonica TaxID=7064 RepID=A0AAW1JTE3_POPJA
MYLDCNNLYGYALSQELPIGDFIEEDCEYFTKDIILSLSDHGDRGYTFVVDLEIPNELHKKIKDYPLLPEHYSPSIDELSNYQKDLIIKKIGSVIRIYFRCTMVKLKPNAKMVIFKNVFVDAPGAACENEAWIAIMQTAIVVNTKLPIFDRFFYINNCEITDGPKSDILLIKEIKGNVCYQLRFPSSISKGDFLEATGNPYLPVPCSSPASSTSS